MYFRPWSRGQGWGCSIGSNRRTRSISELSMIVADKTRGFHRAKLVIINPGLYVDVFWIPQHRSFPTSFMLFTGNKQALDDDDHGQHFRDSCAVDGALLADHLLSSSEDDDDAEDLSCCLIIYCCWILSTLLVWKSLAVQ